MQERLLQLLIDKARALRAAGVTHVELEGLAFDLAPAELEMAEVVPEERLEELDPLNDPATYGRLDGRVPGFPRQPRDDDQEFDT